MKVCARGFNIYLALAVMLALLGGCQTGKKRDKVTSVLRIYLEASADSTDTDHTQTVSVLRSDPVQVTIASDPILTEANVIATKVIDAPGGFAIEVRFDEISSSLLEQYSAANPGRHFVIFGQWGEKPVVSRWLATPLITHRIGNGVLAFTPDCSRAEADRLALGLNNVSEKINKDSLK